MLTNEDITQAGGPQYATLESIEEIVTDERDVDTAQGRFRVRALSFGEVVVMKEGIDETQEWEATKRMLAAGLVTPAVTLESAEALGRLSPTTIGEIITAISELSGMESDDEVTGAVSFSGGSRTG